MRFRAVHLACVMVLLSTFGAAEAHATHGANFAARVHMSMRLQQSSAASESGFPRPDRAANEPALPGEPVAHIRAARPMHPPAAHTLAQHAVTGSGL